jgi:hypothetical protein
MFTSIYFNPLYEGQWTSVAPRDLGVLALVVSTSLLCRAAADYAVLCQDGSCARGGLAYVFQVEAQVGRVCSS